MLTTEGISHVKRYLAGYTPAIAGAMVFGVGTRTEVGGDFGLNFEIARAPINLVTYDFANNLLIYKASVPLDLAGVINEVGLYSTFSDTVAGTSGSKTITDINLGEVWVQSGTSTPSTFVTPVITAGAWVSGPKVGTEGLSQTPGASTTRFDSLSNLALNLSGYSSADFITVAVNFGNANTSSAAVFFLTDASNYYGFTLPSTTAGYKIVDFLKSSAAVTGAPNWNNITEIKLFSQSGAGGASAVIWDGIRMQDTDTANLDYVLVARKVLASPVTKISNQTQDIEFPVSVSVT